MRIYVPTTLAELRNEQFGAGGRTVHKATAELHAALKQDAPREYGKEELEYAAFLAAADTALEILAGAPEVVPRRLVIAADVPADALGPARQGMPGAALPSARELRHALSEIEIMSFHIDEDTQSVREIISQAMAGVQSARERAAELDLLWYDVTERETLLATR